MTMDLILNALASFALLEIWFNGSIFAGIRSKLEARVESPRFSVGFVAELLTCRLCLGTWVCFAVCLCFPLAGVHWLLGFAAVRGAEILMALLAAKLQPELTVAPPAELTFSDRTFWDAVAKRYDRENLGKNGKVNDHDEND